MALDAPGQVISPGPATEPVYWTSFPAASVTADWADPASAHRAVMRLFQTTLPGDPSERRALSGILFRLDVIGGTLTVLVQSSVMPELIPTQGRSLTATGRGWDTQPGDLIAFRVAVNPVIRGKDLRPDGSRRDVTRGVVKPADLPAWLTQRLGGAVSKLEVVNHSRDTHRVGPKGPGRSLVIDTIDALATVANPGTLDRVRREGLGRSKAYGCGLVTARPAVRE